MCVVLQGSNWMAAGAVTNDAGVSTNDNIDKDNDSGTERLWQDFFLSKWGIWSL